jgi:hypothetical protein
MKHKAQQSFSLFEEVKPVTESIVESQTCLAPTVLNPCPKCGRAGLKSVRPQEYGGRKMYCPQCPGEEFGEPLRW